MKPTLEELTEALNKKLIETEEDLNILKNSVTGDGNNLNFSLGQIFKLTAKLSLLRTILSYIKGEQNDIY